VKITHRLAEFVAHTPSEGIPTSAREQARRAFLDTLGVTLAGSREEASRIAADLVREQGSAQEATVIGHGFRAAALEAVLVNGTSAHALDFDDVSTSMTGHPSVPLMPAILALGEKLCAGGREAVDAFVLGFEIECKLGRLIGGPHYSLGWHPTSTFGTLGAAAACSRLLGLDVVRTCAALGIAASLAAGVRQNFGSMTKPLHAGWAARNGVLAALLAERGFTSDAEALEGPGGFLRAASGGARVDAKPLDHLGDPWELVSPGIGVKLYPCCYFTHSAIDAALQLRPAIERDLDAVESIGVSVSPGTTMVLRKTLPVTGLEGKFSMEYCVAAALFDGAVTLGTFTNEAVGRPDILQLMTQVKVSENRPPASVSVGGTALVRAQINGRTVESPVVEIPKGDPRNPLSWEELRAKFRDCASLVIGPDQIEDAIRLIDAFEDARDVGQLSRLLAADTMTATR
jgi:2-methylcitrate dehydratase PrpD